MPDTLDLINQFQSLTSNLLTAKRSEALQLAKKLSQAEASKLKAEQEAEASRAALMAQAAEIAEKNALLAQYQALGLSLS